MRHVAINWGGLRLLHKWGETWRRGSVNERGRGAVFGASAPHDHGVGRGRPTRRLGSARLPRGLHAFGVAVVEAGSRAVLGRGSGSAPSRMLFLRLDWLSRAAEPPPRAFIRSGRGRQKS